MRGTESELGERDNMSSNKISSELCLPHFIQSIQAQSEFSQSSVREVRTRLEEVDFSPFTHILRRTTRRNMTSLKSSFSFKNDKILQIEIDDNTFIRVESVGFAVARLYFVDGGFAEIPIPPGLVVRDETHGGAPVLPLLGNPYFVLAWTDNYSVELNGAIILGMANQRQWAISGPRAAHFQLIDN